MLEFPQQNIGDSHLYIEETDAPLPETLNPKTRYAFFSTIAKGGKSLIKSCRDLHLRRTVCYKTLRPEFVNDPIENKRLLREARISAMLQHPNTIPTYELGRDNRGYYYFTMKLVHGYTLREVLDYRERYDLSQLTDVIMQVTRALGYAHINGVVHRDIKPENVLIGPYGEVLLMDWGLAKVWHKDKEVVEDEAEIEEADTGPGMTGEGKLQGTVMYMSPEQINRDPAINGQSDLYSLGSILYETLTGVTPFQGDIIQPLLDKIRSEKPKDPRAVAKTRIPSILAELTMSCLEKDPQKRPASADDVLRILRES